MDSKLDIIRDKMAEYRIKMHYARQDYCDRDCDCHNSECPYYDDETESWDYDECFRDRGGF